MPPVPSAPSPTPALPRDLPVWEHAAACLRGQVGVVLLCVLQSEGSSPGRQGFKMAVTATELVGSIGGGIMEHKFVELARSMAGKDAAGPALRHQVHRKEAAIDRSGLICSGEQWVLVFPLSSRHLPTVEAIGQVLRTHAGGALRLSAAQGLQLLPAATGYSFRSGPAWEYSERLGFRDQVTIVGGGHVGLALSRVLATLDLELTVLDDRPDLNTHQLNPYAHHKRTVAYDTLAQEIPPGPHQYVILMSFGYRTDLLALRQLLAHPVRYLGVMGSAAKIRELLATLRAEGATAQQLARVRAPIGLPIHSRTPEEIAISVAAELIQERNRPEQRG
ncbi:MULTISPECIES: XdhC family protein [Hymenobacter]|uniref:Xanthine dehydrogenase accessory factor n=1 Tax=Hymenobacter latericoloratus TaxID=1411121 RepID=A0ABR6JUU3_9BACT|nr:MULTISPECIES: XdhC/CoxI family protein [Hymenobacter]MBB4600576.1 xanthine dehydrogenase accessory factor [Hymenobacter latericoloratus]